MTKVFKSLMICRKGSSRSATVKAETDTELAYWFDVDPALSDKRILALVGTLVDYKQRGEQTKRRRDH